jgi:hypothetical protein
MVAKKRKKSSKGSTNLLGSWSFLVGFFLAILFGLGFTGIYQTEMVYAVFFLGIIVGLLNIGASEAHGFLISGTVLVIVTSMGAGIFEQLAAPVAGVLKGILTLFVPATAIVALRAVFVLARD